MGGSEHKTKHKLMRKTLLFLGGAGIAACVLLFLFILFALPSFGAPCANCTVTGATDFRILNNKSPDAVMSFGARMVFTVPVPNGIYEVGLRFQEPNQTWRIGGRIMNVTINDQPILWGFDAYAAAGTNPVERPVLISVTGGKIVVVLTSVVKDGNAILSGLWVQPVEFYPVPAMAGTPYTVPLIMPTPTAPGVGLAIRARFMPDGTRKMVTVPLVKTNRVIPAGFWPDGTRKAAHQVR